MEEIPAYTRDDYLTSTEPFEYLYAHKENKFELKQLLGRMSAQAQTVGVRNLAALFKAYLETVSGSVAPGFNRTDFTGQALELDCGGWTATDTGIYGTDKMGFEVVACYHPIMPVQRLVNVDTREHTHFDEAAKQNLDIITQTQYVDMVSYMPFDICLKADKMSMSQSLELRVPFLDKKVLDVALQLPTACRVDDDHAKYALRVAASKLGFQKKVANMPKQPFITPLTVWLQTDLYYDRIKEAFTSEAAHEFFNVDYLVQMLDDHKSADFSTVEGRGKLKMMRIWNIYCFLCWYEVFFGKSSEQLKPKTKVA